MSEHTVAPVPLAPCTVAGLVNHRGRIVTAIDMRKRLELQKGLTGTSKLVVVRCNHETFGLLVDKVGDVISVDSQSFEPAPESVSENAKELVQGAYKLPDRLLLPLCLDKLAEISN